MKISADDQELIYLKKGYFRNRNIFNINENENNNENINKIENKWPFTYDEPWWMIKNLSF